MWQTGPLPGCSNFEEGTARSGGRATWLGTQLLFGGLFGDELRSGSEMVKGG